MLPIPCADSSRSKSARSPLCMRSTAAADSRVSALAMKATANAAISSVGSARFSRSAGRSQSMASARFSGTSTRLTCKASSRLATVARPTPSKAPGTKRRLWGRNFSHSHITAIVDRPSRPACQPKDGNAWATAAGNAARLSSPEGLGAASSITWTWDNTISTPIPASIPYTTAGAVTRNQQPRRKRPASNCSRPASSRIGPSMATPCWRTSSKTNTANPAAGPLTCSFEPARKPTTRPPMIPVIRPLAGGRPEAMAMPMHKGSATRNTTTEANNSRGRTAFS